MSRRTVWIIVFIILLLGAIPRSIELLNHNYLWGYDQGLFYRLVKDIVVMHKPALIGAEVGGGGFFQGPGWYYLLAIPFFFFSGDPYGGMILMFVIGMATIYLAFFFGEKIFGTTAGLFIALFISLSQGIIPQSRFIWPPFPISLLTVLFLFCIFKFLSGKQRYFAIATFIIGIMSHFEMATAGTLLLQLIVISPFIFWKRMLNFREALLSVGAFLLTLTSILVFDLRHDFLNAKGVVKLFMSSGSGDGSSASYGAIVFNHFQVFKQNFFSTFYMAEVLWIVIIVLFVIGSVLYIKDKKIDISKKLFVGYLATSPLTLFAVFLLYRKPIWEWWILELPIIYCFLTGVIVSYLLHKHIWKYVAGVFIIITVGLFIKHTNQLYINDFNDFGGTHKIKGKIEAIDYIYQDAKGKPFGVLVFTPPVYTDPYDYLLWWYGERTYNYLPYMEKKGTFYLLIEPDPHKPWSYKGWLETVIKDGKIIKTEKLPSGFIIQKRLEEKNEI